ncbi:DUF6445 family protein [Cellvibrio mixtus]|uniref:DUF6445 family protein n=1 Tax=Cellvibrio mixtus TaxID=39650 RepID=UPI00069361D0|nr:DUF6445 family protein [Cellvibrio mixtus]
MDDTYNFSLHPHFIYQTVRVGRDNIPVLVIDNFLASPEFLVSLCVQDNKLDEADTYYPGKRMMAPKQYTYAIYRYLGELIERCFGLPRDAWAGAQSLYSIVATPPEKMGAQQSLPHIDTIKRTDLACVHYLCGAEHGGTSLYRHRGTGFEIIDGARQAIYSERARAEGLLEKSPRTYMNGSDQWFEQIMSVDARFNRLVIYPGNVLHSGNIGPDFRFDPDPASGRLTLNSFIFGKRDWVQQPAG